MLSLPDDVHAHKLWGALPVCRLTALLHKSLMRWRLCGFSERAQPSPGPTPLHLPLLGGLACLVSCMASQDTAAAVTLFAQLCELQQGPCMA